MQTTINYGLKLADEIATYKEWPPPKETAVRDALNRRRAFYDANKTVLKGLHSPAIEEETGYIVDPLPVRISQAYADYLFCEPVKIKAADENDQDRVDEICQENDLDSKLHEVHEEYVSVEGEAWWRIRVDRTVAATPLIEWCSRSVVIPLIEAGKLVAAAFWTCLPHSGNDDVRYRLFEIHADNVRYLHLYRGKEGKLGQRIPLTARTETESLTEEWVHGLPILAGRVTNGPYKGDIAGRSDYEKIVDLLLALNEATTIGAKNVRLVGRKRLFVSSALRKPTETSGGKATLLAVDDDVVQYEGALVQQGTDTIPPVKQIEYSLDAEDLIKYKDDLVNTILTRVGLVPQLIGDEAQGQATSGLELKLRFLPSINAGKGRGRQWNKGLKDAIKSVMLVDQLPQEAEGNAYQYKMVDHPSVTLGSILPQDEEELVRLNATAVTAEIRSKYTAVAAQHPDWDKTQILEELDRIKAETTLEPLQGGTPPALTPDTSQG